ncbi:MAG: hypothetical protein H6716_06015 [Polyangiaceae bacterium]|nr:hypothetical protein [Polyangiaceae bacterium]
MATWGAWVKVCRGALVLTVVTACASQEPAQQPVSPVAPAAPPLSEPPSGEPVASDAEGTPPEPPAAVVATDAPQPNADEDTPEGRRERLLRIDRMTRPMPAAMNEPARPTKLKPGLYQCSVGQGYKLRDCLVEKDSEGRTLLEIGRGNLIAARGVIWDEGRGLHFEGYLTDQRPFGCFSCQDRCYIEPKQCGCQVAPLEVAEACIAQSVSIDFKGAGNTFRGEMTYHQFWPTFEGQGGERHLVVASREEKHPVRLIFSKPICGSGKLDGSCAPIRSTPNRGGSLGE